MSAATRALILAAWRQRWNQLWRFSPIKPGLWLALVQVAFAGLAAWRLGGLGGLGALGQLGGAVGAGGQLAGAAGAGGLLAGATLPLMLLAIGTQAGAGSFLGALARGREGLYTAPALPLVHISPAPPFSLLAAEVGAELPARLWSALLLSAVLGGLLPAGAALWGAPLLALTALLAGTLGQAAGLLSLIAWVRVAPRGLGAAMLVAMLIYAGLLGYLLYLLALGLPVAALGVWLHSSQIWLVGALVGFFGLPGLAMGLWLLAAPDRAGAAYRESWLALKELGDEGSRRRRSRLPALAAGAAGVIQAKDWVQSGRNRLTLLRLAVWAVGLAALVLAGPALGNVPPARRELLLPGLGIGLTWLSLGELVGALFSNEGARIAVYVLAGVTPGRLLAGKLLAAAPFALLSAIGTWVATAAAGAAISDQIRLALTGGALGVGMTAIMVGVGAVRITVQEEPDQLSPEMAAVFEQVPRGGWAWLGLVGALAYAGAGVVAAAGAMPALTPLLIAVLLAAPCVALSSGYLSLRHLIH